MTSASAPRRCQSWIDSFVSYTDGLPTPLIFRRWGAINALAGLLERRVWTVTSRREVYGNLFTLLVAPPGIGKSEILRVVTDLWKSVKDLPGGRKLHVSPDDLTKGALVQVLSKSSTRLILDEATLTEYHSLLVSSSEFSVFLPTYDTVFMSVLTDLYDCRDTYHQHRVGSGELSIPYPQLHLIAGTTPGFMSTTFPEQAWSMGFSSRLILIYSHVGVKVKLFGGSAPPKTLWPDLVGDARDIAQLYGKVSWTTDAEEFLSSWDTSGCMPVPTHPKLMTYNTRRILQVIKLCLIASISRSSELLIRVEDVATAIAWLLEAEQHMPDIFREMGGATGGGGSGILLDLHHWAMATTEKTKAPILEGRVINFVARRVQYPNQVLPILQLAIKNGMFRVEDNLWTPLGGQ